MEINELEIVTGRIEDLEADLQDAQLKIALQELQLEIAADLLAEHGLITNTPYAKRRWIEGE